MSNIWTIARHMIAEGIRMKLALVFLALIGLVVVGLPFSITGDSSLTGSVQSFLAYSLHATGVLLGLLTIFLSRSMADELVGHQIFLVMTKPVPRWQYVLGKWVGITTLTATLCEASFTTRHPRSPGDRFLGVGCTWSAPHAWSSSSCNDEVYSVLSCPSAPLRVNCLLRLRARRGKSVKWRRFLHQCYLPK